MGCTCSMPSKGIQAYTYISGPSLTISLSIPANSKIITDQRVFGTSSFEIDAAEIKWPLRRTGRFSFAARKSGHELLSKWFDVDPVTGDVRSRSTMDDTMKETRSVVEKDVITSFGLYEAGPGNAGLPSRHQCYVSVTENFSGWMGSVAPVGSDAEKGRFAALALPAPHDVGMNSMATMDAVLSHAGGAAAQVLTDLVPVLQRGQDSIGKILSGISDSTVAKIAPDIIASLSITQKDTLPTMLALGARYFEFRPAHCHTAILKYSPLPDKLYFQHGPIPGMAYDQFLSDLVKFLVENPTEIAVVHLRWDGVPAECKRPDDAELKAQLDAALALSNGALEAGSLKDLKEASIASLRAKKQRLLYFSNARVLSTYDDAANATVDGKSMLAAFKEKLNETNQEGKSLTIAQCQATPTNIQDVIYYSVVTAGVSNLALMATKGLCGHLLYPWLRESVVGRLRGDQLLVLMDDFVEGGQTDVAVELSRRRLGGQ